MAVPVADARLSYSIDDGLAIIGIGKTKGYEEIKAGRLKCFKVGNRTLISRKAIEQYIADREAEAEANHAHHAA